MQPPWWKSIHKDWTPRLNCHFLPTHRSTTTQVNTNNRSRETQFGANTKPVSSLKHRFLTLLADGKYKTSYLQIDMILRNNNLLRLKGVSTKNNYLLKGGSMTFSLAPAVYRNNSSKGWLNTHRSSRKSQHSKTSIVEVKLILYFSLKTSHYHWQYVKVTLLIKITLYDLSYVFVVIFRK